MAKAEGVIKKVKERQNGHFLCILYSLGNLKKHMRVHGKEPPQIMHQNNKGKPAPNQPQHQVTHP